MARTRAWIVVDIIFAARRSGLFVAVGISSVILVYWRFVIILVMLLWLRLTSSVTSSSAGSPTGSGAF